MDRFVTQLFAQVPMWLWVLAVLLAVFAVGSAILFPNGKRRQQAARAAAFDGGPSPFKAAASMLSPGERLFYDVLAQSVGAETLILLKVRMLDLFEQLPPALPQRKSHLNRVTAKHVDFLLCDRRTLRPLLIIELDDRTHERPTRKLRDAAVDAIFKSAGLPILHYKQRQQYVASELTREVSFLLAGRKRSGK